MPWNVCFERWWRSQHTVAGRKRAWLNRGTVRFPTFVTQILLMPGRCSFASQLLWSSWAVRGRTLSARCLPTLPTPCHWILRGGARSDLRICVGLLWTWPSSCRLTFAGSLGLTGSCPSCSLGTWSVLYRLSSVWWWLVFVVIDARSLHVTARCLWSITVFLGNCPLSGVLLVLCRGNNHHTWARKSWQSSSFLNSNPATPALENHSQSP